MLVDLLLTLGLPGDATRPRGAAMTRIRLTPESFAGTFTDDDEVPVFFQHWRHAPIGVAVPGSPRSSVLTAHATVDTVLVRQAWRLRPGEYTDRDVIGALCRLGVSPSVRWPDGRPGNIGATTRLRELSLTPAPALPNTGVQLAENAVVASHRVHNGQIQIRLPGSDVWRPDRSAEHAAEQQESATFQAPGPADHRAQEARRIRAQLRQLAA